MLKRYQNTLGGTVVPTKIPISSDTLQIKDHGRYNGTIFHPDARKERRQMVFPENKKPFALGPEMINRS